MKKILAILGLALPMLGLSLWLLAASAGWGTTTASAIPTRPIQPGSSTMTLDIIRRGPLSFPIRIVTVTVHDDVTITALYRHLLALRVQPTWVPGTYVNCPVDTDLSYDMTFYHDTKLLLHASAYPTGCSSVTLGKNDLRECDLYVRMTLLNLVNAAIGVPTAAYTP